MSAVVYSFMKRILCLNFIEKYSKMSNRQNVEISFLRTYFIMSAKKIYIKPCSRNMRIVNRKFYEVKIEPFGQFHVNLNANKHITYAQECVVTET